MLATRQLKVALGGRTVMADATLSLSGGTVIGLIGPNGAGKTTLLRALTGIIPAEAGVITLDDRPLAGWPPRTLARNITSVAQDAPCSWPMTVRRVVALGRLPHLQPWQRPTPADGEAIEEALQQADVLFLDNRNVLTLSGGERARVMLARALAGGPRYLLADEPVAGLDPAHQLQMMALLRERAAAGVGVIVTLHNLSLAGRFAIGSSSWSMAGLPRTAPRATFWRLRSWPKRSASGPPTAGHDGQRYVVPWEVVPRLSVVDRRQGSDGHGHGE